MLCPQCRFENRARVSFCEECGAILDVACASCGATVPAGRKFCGSCGQPLAAQPAAAKFASPEAYTPRHLAEKILTSKAALEGERKQVTVLFCDIVDSSRLAERLDPEAMHEVMDRALRLMAEAVHRYEGTVNQFLSDGLMALFGAPVALEITPFGGSRRPWRSRKHSAATASNSSGTGTWSFTSALASIRVSSSWAESATTCEWTTPPWGTRPTSRRACRVWPSPGRS